LDVEESNRSRYDDKIDEDSKVRLGVAFLYARHGFNDLSLRNTRVNMAGIVTGSYSDMLTS
jgi:hypothetical protein